MNISHKIMFVQAHFKIGEGRTLSDHHIKTNLQAACGISTSIRVAHVHQAKEGSFKVATCVYEYGEAEIWMYPKELRGFLESTTQIEEARVTFTMINRGQTTGYMDTEIDREPWVVDRYLATKFCGIVTGDYTE